MQARFLSLGPLVLLPLSLLTLQRYGGLFGRASKKIFVNQNTAKINNR